jgi:hypothetical protein
MTLTFVIAQASVSSVRSHAKRPKNKEIRCTVHHLPAGIGGCLLGGSGPGSSLTETACIMLFALTAHHSLLSRELSWFAVLG